MHRNGKKHFIDIHTFRTNVDFVPNNLAVGKVVFVDVVVVDNLIDGADRYKLSGCLLL